MTVTRIPKFTHNYLYEHFEMTFDKVTDDTLPRTRWPSFRGRPSLILVDGWCLGAGTQDPHDLKKPVNSLEEREDPNLAWRNAVNVLAMANTISSPLNRVDPNRPKPGRCTLR